jgi:hypothetical protein
MEWTDDIEDILKKVRENCITMRAYHLKRYYQYKRILPFFKIPVLILSALNSVFSVGLQPYMEQSLISVLNCIISLITTIINSIEMYMGIQKSLESEFVSSQGFYILSIDIFKTLSLKRENRDSSGKQYLTECYNLYEELIKKSKLIKDPELLLLDKLQITGDIGVEMYLSQSQSGNTSGNNIIKNSIKEFMGGDSDTETIVEADINPHSFIEKDKLISFLKKINMGNVKETEPLIREEKELLKIYREYNKENNVETDSNISNTSSYNIPYPKPIHFIENITEINDNKLNKIKSIGKEYIDEMLESNKKESIILNDITSTNENVESSLDKDKMINDFKIEVSSFNQELTPGMPQEYQDMFKNIFNN